VGSSAVGSCILKCNGWQRGCAGLVGRRRQWWERGFGSPSLDEDTIRDLKARARTLRGAILTMTTLAGSGHPGGSMSSLEIYLVLAHFASIDPMHPRAEGRDHIVVSHGHTSPGLYCALADAGFFDLEDAVAHFRQAGSVFEGTWNAPFQEWSGAQATLGRGCRRVSVSRSPLGLAGTAEPDFRGDERWPSSTRGRWPRPGGWR